MLKETKPSCKTSKTEKIYFIVIKHLFQFLTRDDNDYKDTFLFQLCVAFVLSALFVGADSFSAGASALATTGMATGASLNVRR